MIDPPAGRTGEDETRFLKEGLALNYRHEFHAGNFADLLKHAIVLAWIKRLGGAGGLTVLDTHAGAGLYDLKSEAARKSGEAALGVAKLMADAAAPPVFSALKRAVQAENGPGQLRFYPGSPAVVLRALQSGDRYIGCELRPDDHAELAKLTHQRGGEALCVDGYAALAEGRAGDGRRLVLIDPPFERGDEYPNIVEAVRADRARGQGEAAYAIWTPLKDLQTFDSFLGGIEGVGFGGGLAVEARLRPLADPMKLNGCAMVLLGPAAAVAGVEPAATQAAEWVVRALGREGGQARVEHLG
jgi:23S rRNA (adenine2030-N6)-methyltransferase